MPSLVRPVAVAVAVGFCGALRNFPSYGLGELSVSFTSHISHHIIWTFRCLRSPCTDSKTCLRLKGQNARVEIKTELFCAANMMVCGNRVGASPTVFLLHVKSYRG